ncbi:capsule polysaccharide transporter [Thiomicrorhabdus immobilis]|uniref:Capsule polysaccharide transporter n=1 Tax=Thiomicrorhabdus immobilis TaxID=2791037 RepID=A0ABN6CXT5_9GAMM|nr:capsular polysaccharide biosynthesis protein [Thiomicrorhabdus immobilis]BCN92732.1 capsule polysaccharide transporter [Thiomicrorhabdus immobilis]
MNPFNIKSGYQFYWYNLKALFTDKHFVGWGRKRTGRLASWCAKTFNGQCTLYEDGFIRSIGLGVDGAPLFSVVEDDKGIYYDATQPSKLENLLNETDFGDLPGLVNQAELAIEQVIKHQISKYNLAQDVPNDFFPKNEKRILVIAQTAGDASLKYGLAEQITTQQILQAAIDENPDAKVYLKVHPDVASGKKQSDISIDSVKQYAQIITESFNPISLLKFFDKVYTKTSQMGFEALLLNKQCVCFGMPFYAGWGCTDDRVKLERRTKKRSVSEIFAIAYMLYPKYFNPYTQKESDIFDTISTIARIQAKSRQLKYLSNTQAFLFGFSRWKHNYIKPFLRSRNHQSLQFINPLFGQSHLKIAQQQGLNSESTRPGVFYIWGKKAFAEVESYAKKHNIPIFRVEDGFIRSNSLGSDLTQPYSLVIDSQGIYFDPTQPSDLEIILQTYDFDSDSKLIERSQQVIDYLVENKLSKYNLYENKLLQLPANQKFVLIPGQVEDDASIKYGANSMTNLALLKQVRLNCPEAYIIYKPHPDVLVGNRIGHIEEEVALQYCNQVITKVGIDTVLEHAYEVHTMTSLVGFEALLRNKKVVTYGMPFYAGWGLTEDKQICNRRTQRLSLPGLVAATLLMYPTYINPKNHAECELEAVFVGLHEQKQNLENSFFLRFKQNLRNKVVRFLLKIVSRFS